MNISLKNNYVSSLTLEKIQGKRDVEKTDKFTLSYNGSSDRRSPKEFKITFDIELSDNRSIELKVQYVSVFSTDEDVNEEFMTGPFAKINAPAIGYPFLRSYISTLTINSGFPPIILPTINFVKLSKEDKEQKPE